MNNKNISRLAKIKNGMKDQPLLAGSTWKALIGIRSAD
jgi:hypothetical protein